PAGVLLGQQPCLYAPFGATTANKQMPFRVSAYFIYTVLGVILHTLMYSIYNVQAAYRQSNGHSFMHFLLQNCDI
ncbi:MAG: hypothetical protein Q4A83_08975, partial [Bacillota bacterium]|nr:hypothetical protein [Bacillota bacterium]